jgi:hypothetical protein
MRFIKNKAQLTITRVTASLLLYSRFDSFFGFTVYTYTHEGGECFTQFQRTFMCLVCASKSAFPTCENETSDFITDDDSFMDPIVTRDW